MKKISLILLLLISTFLQANESQQINNIVNNLGTQLSKNNNKMYNNSKIAITSFVLLDNINKSSKIGRILSENLIHELQTRGYSIIDFKTRNDIKITPNGDFLFSTNIEELRHNHNIGFVLSGTMSKFQTGIEVNARILNINTHEVVSSGKVWIPNKLVNKIDYQPHMVQLVQR
jgi:TolB-like protein